MSVSHRERIQLLAIGRYRGDRIGSSDIETQAADPTEKTAAFIAQDSIDRHVGSSQEVMKSEATLFGVLIGEVIANDRRTISHEALLGPYTTLDEELERIIESE